MELLNQIASELSFIKSLHADFDWYKTLHYCHFELESHAPHYEPTSDDHLLQDVITKILKRGTFPFPSFDLEKKIIALYGKEFQIQLNRETEKGVIDFTFKPNLRNSIEDFCDFVDPWTGELGDLSFDPEEPVNEKRFFSKLLNRFGPTIVNLIQMQVPISNFVDPSQSKNFLSQRVDFLLSLPNGKSLIIEPGDHSELGQKAKDTQRDKAFSSMGIQTLRFENSQIDEEYPYIKIEEFIENNDYTHFFDKYHETINSLQESLNYLILLPSLIARCQYLLSHFFFGQGLIHQPSLSIGVVERDLECAVLAFADFKNLVLRLSDLYGIPPHFPKIRLFIQHVPSKINSDFSTFEISPTYVETFDDLQLDLILDVGIKCNPNTLSLSSDAPHIGSVRRSFPHNHPVQFGYLSRPRPIEITQNKDFILKTFLQDFFRKWSFREGQLPIIENILLQKHTIGLLPTSAGKSICFQLASIITPGTTIIVDPITALMKNQVKTLEDSYGVDRAYAWYSSDSARQSVSSILSSYIMIFISPERLLRDSFRTAMRNLTASDIFINYAVVDEAHCLSMWGHDFRPSYLMLESNIRSFCKFGSITPPIVALTGTASQLVLIDLRRELDIDDLASIIRPKSFDRSELNFHLTKCTIKQKPTILTSVEKAIARRLNVQDLSQEATGIIFAYTPKELWELLSAHLEDPLGHVFQVQKAKKLDEVTFGVYCGSAPEGFPSAASVSWEIYKEKVLDLFQQGNIRMLFGNTAIGVGLDNSKINYIINYEMPQSLEAYYQMCGRAGREKQRSECYLIFSDDDPFMTNQWLNRQIPKMEKRHDDLGIVSFFHQDNFPGKTVDSKGTQQVFAAITKKPIDSIIISADLDGTFSSYEAKRTEKYISYLFMLGFISDYEVDGINTGARYRIKLADEVKRFLQSNDHAALEGYLIQNLHTYLNRYKPVSYKEVQKRVRAQKEPYVSARCIGYLIDFIYDQIEYQRREAIRTMVNFCNEEDTDPERLRSRIVAYFDRSEKFSETLIQMANSLTNINPVVEILKKVDDFNDGELLYYETRRLLDERLRPDWLSTNMFAYIFRGGGRFTQTFGTDLIDLQRQLTAEPNLDEKRVHEFLAVYLSQFLRLDEVFEKELGVDFIAKSLLHLAKNFGTSYLALIPQLELPKEIQSQIELMIVNIQIKEILNAHYTRIIN